MRERDMSEKQLRNVRTEVEVLQELNGRPNIVQLFGTFREDGYLHLCMERCEGDLQTYINKALPPIPEKVVRCAGRQVATAVAQLHRLGIVHRDIKPRNVLLMNVRGGGPHLLDGKYELKLSDFGLASRTKLRPPAAAQQQAEEAAAAEASMAQTWCGTPLYMAPELVYKTRYDERIDLYALGTVFYQLRTKTTPVRAKNIEDLRLKLPSRNLTWPRGTSKSLKDLCNMLLSNDPSLRPPASEVLMSPFFQDQLAQESVDIIDEYVMIDSLHGGAAANDTLLRHQLLMAAIDREYVGSTRRKYLFNKANDNLDSIGSIDKRHRLKRALQRRKPADESVSETAVSFDYLVEHSLNAEHRGDTKVAALLLRYSKLLTFEKDDSPPHHSTAEEVSNMLTAQQPSHTEEEIEEPPGVVIPAKFCYNCGTRFTNRTHRSCQCGYPRHNQSV